MDKRKPSELRDRVNKVLRERGVSEGTAKAVVRGRCVYLIEDRDTGTRTRMRIDDASPAELAMTMADVIRCAEQREAEKAARS